MKFKKEDPFLNDLFESNAEHLDQARRPALIRKFVEILKEQNLTPLDNIIDFFNLLINPDESANVIVVLHGLENSKLFKEKLTKEFGLDVNYILEDEIKDSELRNKIKDFPFKTRKKIKILKISRKVLEPFEYV